MIGSVFAHGVGGAQDLPIPAALAIGGAGAALSVSFMVLMFAWRTPRFDMPDPSGPDETDDDRRLHPVSLAFGVAAFALIVVAALFGPADDNPVFGLVFIWVWVGIIPLSLLLGRIWRHASPIRALLTVIGGRRAVPDGIGLWPAAIGLFAFVWIELASGINSEITTIWIGLAVYVVGLLAGGIAFGPQWCDHADPFQAYSDLIGRLGPVGTGSLRRLSRLPVQTGLIPVVAVLLGSTAFDSFSNRPAWTEEHHHDVGLNTIVLLAFIAAVAAIFTVSIRQAPMYAHSLVPIIVGYMTAHYLSLLLEGGQDTVIDLLHLNAEPHLFLSDHRSLLASIKVIAVVTGHVFGVISAHDRALQVLPKRQELTGQLGLLFVMVGFTLAGLFLLFSH